MFSDGISRTISNRNTPVVSHKRISHVSHLDDWCVCKVFIITTSVMTAKAALCHMTRAQLRDAEVGLPVASPLATLAVSSNPGGNSRLFPPF